MADLEMSKNATNPPAQSAPVSAASRRAAVVIAFGLLIAAAIASFGHAGAQTQATTAQASDTQVLQGQTVRIATKPLEPFVFVEGQPQQCERPATAADPCGFSVDYWNAVADQLGVETEWVAMESVGDIIDAAQLGTVDASIAGISITREREAVIDFSQPYYTAGQQIATRAAASSGPLGTISGLFGPRFLFALAALAVLVIVVSHLVWLFERGHDSDDFPYEYRAGIGEAMWWSTVSVLTGGEAVKNINTALSRLIAIFWMVIGFFVLAWFTATLASETTVDALESNISGLEDLRSGQVATVEATASVPFLQERGLTPTQFADLDSALDSLLSGRAEAVVFDAPVLSYALSQNDYADLVLIEPKLGRDPYGIALTQNSDLLEPVNAAVIEIGRDGRLDELMAKWFTAE